MVEAGRRLKRVINMMIRELKENVVRALNLALVESKNKNNTKKIKN